MKTRLPLFEHSSGDVFRQLHSWSELVNRLSNIHLKGTEQIHLAVIVSHHDLVELLRSKPHVSYMRKKSSHNINLFRLSRTVHAGGPTSISQEFAVVRPQQEFIYIVIFISEPRVWRIGMLPLIESLYPRAARPFLTQPELQRLLKKIQARISSEHQRLRVLEFSAKKRLAGHARKRFESERKWTDADLESVFNEASEQGIWFRSVSFDIASEKPGRISSTGVRGKLSKYGYFRCNGSFDLFSRAVVDDLLHYAYERLKFFSKRDRLSTPDHAPRPVQIRYERDVFKTSGEMRKLVEAMHRFKHGTCTVLHANPYLHLSLVDNLDLSSADLWVLSNNEILIVPQLRASDAALKRIVNHVFEYFREGKISEFEAQSQI